MGLITPKSKRCHDAGPTSCCATCLGICVGCFLSVDSECCNRIFRSLSVMMEQIPYAPCRQWQKKKNQFCLDIALSFVRSQWIWSLPLRRLLRLLRVVPKYTRFITSSDVGGEVWVVFRLFLDLDSDSDAVFLLIFAHQPWHKFCCNGLHVELIWQIALAISMRQPDSVAKVVNRSSLVFQESLLHSFHIFDRGSHQMSPRTLIIIIIAWHTSFLKRLNPP